MPQCLEMPTDERVMVDAEWCEAAAVVVARPTQLWAPDPLEDAPRLDLVRRIRAAIADGTYETDERLDTALDGLLDSLAAIETGCLAGGRGA